MKPLLTCANLCITQNVSNHFFMVITLLVLKRRRPLWIIWPPVNIFWIKNVWRNLDRKKLTAMPNSHDPMQLLLHFVFCIYFVLEQDISYWFLNILSRLIRHFVNLYFLGISIFFYWIMMLWCCTNCKPPESPLHSSNLFSVLHIF